jgi:isoamylase
MNANHEGVDFVLPDEPDGKEWNLLLDTNDPAHVREKFKIGATYSLGARTLALFLLATRHPAPEPDPKLKTVEE